MLALSDLKIFSDGSVEVYPSAPPDPNDITTIKRSGVGIATLSVDMLTPRWNYKPRQPGGITDRVWPQTVVFNEFPKDGKGNTLPLTQAMKDFIVKLTDVRTLERILNPPAGWINSDGMTNKTQRLSWAANHVIVLERGPVYSRVFAPRYDSALATTGTFFEKDHAFHIHKVNAITPKGTLVKPGTGYDCYTPFVSDGDMWLRNDTIEMWPELPFLLDDGRSIVEYDIYGANFIYGVLDTGALLMLRDPIGFKTNWKIQNPLVP